MDVDVDVPLTLHQPSLASHTKCPQGTCTVKVLQCTKNVHSEGQGTSRFGAQWSVLMD